MAAASAAGGELARRIESHLEQLPVLPLAVARLMSLDPADEDYFDEIVELAEQEPNFAARVFQAANSVASAPTDPVATLRGAVARIGSRGAGNLVLALAVTTVFVPRDPWERSLWRHGVQVAHAARALARLLPRSELDPETVYAAALLHDLGRFVLFQVDPEQLRLVDEGDWDRPETLVQQELSICGLSHPEIGALACRKWGLPEVITEAVAGHHRPIQPSVASPADRVLTVIRMADLAMFPSAVPGSPGLHEVLDDEALESHLAAVTPPGLARVPVLRGLMASAAEEAETVCRSLGLTG